MHMGGYSDSAQTEQDNVFTVSQLTGLIKTMLERTFPSVLLKGEISNFRPSANGHLYFVLKDEGAQITAVMFRGKASSLTFSPKDGMLVQVKGALSVYPPRGNYQFIITSMTKAGMGDIMEMIEERKRKLQAEGLFDSARKRPLPLFPSTVGVVTSPTGAALRDILQITRRRNDAVSVTVLPALVQGEEAAQSIVSMIQAANRWQLCDVLIVGRGGGSLEDLLPFSEESVVRAIAASRIPVVSAVGHEIDWALSDFAADIRAPTPSAAAELVVPLKTALMDSIQNERETLCQAMQQRLQNLRLMLLTFTPESMEMHVHRITQPLRHRLELVRTELPQQMRQRMQDSRHRVAQCMQLLEVCNPQTIFERGYSMVTDSTGAVIRNAADIPEGSTITVRPARGTLTATVTHTTPREDP